MWHEESINNREACWLLFSAHAQCPRVCIPILRFFLPQITFPTLVCSLSSLNLQESGCVGTVTCDAHHQGDSASSGFWKKQQNYILCFICPFGKLKTYEGLAETSSTPERCSIISTETSLTACHCLPYEMVTSTSEAQTGVGRLQQMF